MELKKYKLSDLCIPNKIGIYGIPASAEDFSEDKIRYLRISDISDDGILLDNDKKSVTDKDIEKYILEENDIVFARTGNSTGRAYLYDSNDGILAFAGFLIKYQLDNTKVNPRFVRYFTISEYYKQWVKNLSVGSTRGNISAQTFADCPIILPPRQQQDGLAFILHLIDRKIALNRAINRNLEAFAKQLYDYWFVQFDFPDENGKPYKSSGGKMVWNEVLKREIPKGWEVKPLETFISKNNTGDWGADAPAKIQTLEVGCIRGADIVALTDLPKRYIKNNNESKLLSNWDMVIEVSGGSPTQATARCAYITPGVIERNGGRITCSNFCHAFSFKDYHDSAYFFFTWKLFYDNDIMFNYEGKTSGIKNFMTETFLANEWIKPPKPLVDAFFEQIKTIYAKIDNSIAEITALTRQRDELLPLLMNGQVGVGE